MSLKTYFQQLKASSLFNNPKKAVIAVTIVIGLFLLALATSSHASGNSVTFRAGATILRGPATVVELSVAKPLGDGQLEGGFGLIGSSTYNDSPTQRNQAFAVARYVDGFGHFDIGAGVVKLQHADLYNSGAVNFNLLVGWHYRSFSVRYNHFSNAGTSSPNLGRDMVVLGWTFK